MRLKNGQNAGYLRRSLLFISALPLLLSGCFFGAFNNQGEFTTSSLTQSQETAVGNPVLQRVGTGPETFSARSCQGPYRYSWIGSDSQPTVRDFNWLVSLVALPDSLEVFSDSACTVALSPSTLRINAGESHSGEFYLNSKFGENYSLELATVTADGATSSVTFEMEFRGPVESVSLGYQGGCAIQSDGRLICWGVNHRGNNGSGNPGIVATAKAYVKTAPSSDLGGVIKVARGHGTHTCAISLAGLFCWGDNMFGALGIGVVDNSTHEYATLISGAGNPSEVATASRTTCMRESSRDIHCWGNDSNGRLGQTAGFDNSLSPPGPLTISGVTSLGRGGEQHFCVLMGDETIKCWGFSGSAQAGVMGGGGAFSETPNPITGAVGVLGLAVGHENNCVILKPDNHVSCFGKGSNWMTGSSSGTDTNTVGTEIKTSVSQNLTGVTQVAVGRAAACAITATGSVACWGGSHTTCSGQNCGDLGTGNRAGSIYAVEVPAFAATGSTPGGVTDISADEYTFCVVRYGDVYCWGRNLNGQLGIPDVTAGFVTTPVLHESWP